MLRPAAILAATLLLAGCMPSQPNVTPPPEPSATPIFATDEEALAAATEAYAKYLEVSDAVFANGGANPNALSGVLTGKQLQIERNGFAEVKANGWHGIGSTLYEQIRLQQYDAASSGESIVTVYVCEDISNTDVLDSSGASVRAPSLPNRSLFEVTFDQEASTSHLLVSGRTLWESGKC